jgi:hypothetical protein
VWSDPVTLNALHFYVRLGDSLLERDQPDHPVRESVPDILDVLNTEISRSRTGICLPRDPFGSLDLCGSKQAAVELQRSQKRVHQIGEALGGRKIEGVGWIFDRAAVKEYADRKKRK